MDQEATPRACGCGHDREAHRHFRRGSDCGQCGRQVCPRFHDATGPWWRRTLSRLGA